jgi:Flp pilus assembly pilin Flp
MKNLFNRFVREEEGQDIIEYALLAAFVSIACWGMLQTLGLDVNTIYAGIDTQVQTAGAAVGGGS